MSEFVPVSSVAALLSANHYLGAARRGLAFQDAAGVIVVASPTARGVPNHWLELSRWCLIGRVKNAGSSQWAAFIRALRIERPDVTTIVSYSDPSAGHDGALYRACNWWWAPTWHRLRPPPSGNGSWQTGKIQSVKDRWIFPVRRDPDRATVLVARDASILRKYPLARYVEPGGVPYRTVCDLVGI